MDRRKFITTASGGALSTFVAGCTGGGGDGGGGGTDDAAGGTDNATGDAIGGNGTETKTETGAGNQTGGDGAGGGTDFRGAVEQTPAGVEVSNVRVSETDTGVEITGRITNTGDATYEQLEVQATLFDDTDDVIGRFFDDTEGEETGSLAPGQTWRFRIDFPSANVRDGVRYRLDVDTRVDDFVDVGLGGDNSTDAGSAGDATTAAGR